jgi:hypothetical protein
MKCLKKISILSFFICLLCAEICKANSFDDFLRFLGGSKKGTYTFGDPQNPGLNGGDRNYNYPKLEAPWNRDAGRGGRNDKNCLYQFNLNDYGGTATGYSGFYDAVCAQDIDGNRYNNTKIRLKSVVCSFGGCFDNQLDLDGLNGECNMFPMKELVTARRVCARIASPPGDNSDANHQDFDDGYTYAYDQSIKQNRGRHLDSYGVTQLDELYDDGMGGSPFAILKPKICAYYDPWMLDLYTVFEGDFPDLFDINPINQIFHKSAGDLSPIVKIIIFIITSYANMANTGVNLLDMICSAVMGVLGGDSAKHLLETVFQFFSSIIDKILSFAVEVLEAIGQINRVVLDHYGCIEIPLANYPPPYCSSLTLDATPVGDAICSTNSNGVLMQNCFNASLQGVSANCSPSKCVVSSVVDNNFIYNSARVGYSNMLPICPSNGANSTYNTCVNFSATRKAAIQNKDLVTGVTAKDGSLNSSQSYRVVYETMSVDSSGQTTQSVDLSNYSYIDLPDCDSIGKTSPNSYVPTNPNVVLSSKFCQKIWGVDIGDYSDNFIIDYRGVQTLAALQSAPIALTYKRISGNVSTPITKTFYSKIDPNSAVNSILLYQKGTDGASDKLIGNLNRGTKPALTVSPCSTGQYASQTQLNVMPCMNLSFTNKGVKATYNSSLVLRYDTAFPNAANASIAQSTAPSVAFGGLSVTGYVTDQRNQLPNYTANPPGSNSFIDPSTNSISTISILGRYLDQSKIYSSSCDWDSCAKYLNGLEVLSNRYVRGGSWFCVDTSFDNSCQNDPTQCVLANKLPDNSAVSNKLSDVISPTVNISNPVLPITGYYAQSSDAQNCLNNVKAKYSGISQCIPLCSTNGNQAPCLQAPKVESNECGGSTVVYSYLPSDINNPQAQVSGTLSTTDINGNAITNALAIDQNGNLIFTQSNDTGAVEEKTLVQIDINTSIITIWNTTFDLNGTNYYVTNVDMSKPISSALTTTSTLSSDIVSGAAKAPDMPSASLANSSVSISSGTTTITTTPTNYSATLTDRSNSKPQLVATIDIATGAVNMDQTSVSSNGIVTTFHIAFNQFTRNVTSSTTVYNPSAGTTTVTTQDNNGNDVVVQTTVVGNVTTSISKTVDSYGNPKQGFTIAKVVTTITGNTAVSVTSYTDYQGNPTGTSSTTSSTILPSNRYYCYTQSSASSIPSNQGTRTKVGAERPNRCVAVPAANNCPGVSASHVNWSASSTGQQVTGTCDSGYEKINPSEDFGRYCLLQYSGGSYISAFDSLASGFQGCKRVPCGITNIRYTNTTKNFTGTKSAYFDNGYASGKTFGFDTLYGNYVSLAGSVINTFTLTFDIYGLQNVQLKLQSLKYDDGVRVSVNGVQITSDSARDSAGFRAWPNRETGMVHNYPSLSNLSAKLQQNLKEGANTIIITCDTWGGGGVYASFVYTNTCPAN